MTLGCGDELDREPSDPDDGIARKHAPPTVIAGHIRPLAVTNLRQGVLRIAQGEDVNCER